MRATASKKNLHVPHPHTHAHPTQYKLLLGKRHEVNTIFSCLTH